MRFTQLLLLLIPFLALGQEKVDSIPPVPRTTNYLVGNVWNGTVITAIQNPAFAGFDRRLQVGYSYEGQNLKVPEGRETRKSAFWNQTAIVDFAFGGNHDNIGVNITYNGGQRMITDYHRLQVAHSYRLLFKSHRFILGASIRYLQLKGGLGSAVYGDMIDPTYGFVYQTNELSPAQDSNNVEFSAGLIYNWKRVFFSYAFRFEHRSLLLPVGYDHHPVHHLHASYALTFGASSQFSIGFTAEHNGFNWQMDPSALLMWKIAFIKVSAPYLKQIKAEIGFQFWRLRAVYAVSTYFDEYMIEQNGIASMSGGLRYHFQPLIPKKK